MEGITYLNFREFKLPTACISEFGITKIELYRALGSFAGE